MLERIADGRTDLVYDWLDEGGSPEATDEGGTSLARWCAYYGDVSALRLLLRHGVSLEALGANHDLNGAAFHGHWTLCQFLLEHGADPNHALPGTGETPLHSALCKAGRPVYDDVVRVLLAHGADPARRTREGAATSSFMRDARTRGETPLHRAAAFGTVESIGMLLDAGARVDARDMDGDTPLAWASWHLRPDVVLRKLCYGDFEIHPDRSSSYDHGSGWGAMEGYLRGTPHV